MLTVLVSVLLAAQSTPPGLNSRSVSQIQLTAVAQDQKQDGLMYYSDIEGNVVAHDLINRKSTVLTRLIPEVYGRVYSVQHCKSTLYFLARKGQYPDYKDLLVIFDTSARTLTTMITSKTFLSLIIACSDKVYLVGPGSEIRDLTSNRIICNMGDRSILSISVCGEALLAATRDSRDVQAMVSISTRNGSVETHINSVEADCLTISKTTERTYALSSKYHLTDGLNDRNSGAITIYDNAGKVLLRKTTSFQPWYLAECNSKLTVVSGIAFTLSPSSVSASDGYLAIYDNKQMRPMYSTKIPDCAPKGIISTKSSLYCVYSNGQVYQMAK